MKKISALSTGIVATVLFAATNPVSANPVPQGLEERLLEEGGAHRGICAVLGIDADLSLRLARESGLLVHVRDPRPGAVLGLRKEADQAGLGIRRLAAEQGGLDALPYADNTIDLIIVSQANELLGQLSAAEVLRALRPEGIALIGQRDLGPDAGAFAQKLKAWAGRGDAKTAAWNDPSGVWIKLQKPPLKGADDWSHWEKNPDNNPVSQDQVIKAPYMTQFMANPLYIGMPSITTAAAGRTFLAIGHIAHHRREWDGLLRIIARSGYNGKVLWERKLPQGYLVHRSAFIATRETFYMIDGDRCLMLDAQTGSKQGEIRIPGVKGHWKWMALHDGTLYVLTGKPDPGTEITKGDRAFGGWSWADLSKGYYGSQIPFGFGDTVAAFDLGQQATRWVHREETLIDSRGMAILENRMFLYCPESHLRSLDIRSGEIEWTNANKAVLDLIGQPGRGLTSTPGFRTACMLVATPQALIVQGQTRMNVIAVSTETGDLLWQRKKITNNPNAIYLDNKVILGVGERGSHVVVDPVSGEIEQDLEFFKRACTRLTASSDSLFCRGGEGTIRFDRSQRKVLIDGAARPACNDGALPANGMLYIGPWQCDCNLSIIGHLGKCSAGAFRFDHLATDAERLQTTGLTLDTGTALKVTDQDWPTYRSNNSRSASTRIRLRSPMQMKWQSRPTLPTIPTPPTAAGGLVFTGGEDGKIRAIDAADGSMRWEYLTPGPIKQSPTIWNGRAYAGGGDGQVYCLDAATGQLLWRFRAAPVERHIMVYGSLCSTWPAHSGVLVHDGVAYVGAGIIDHDGTYVYALDAESGKILWQNNSSGHLNAELRKGVSVQGNLSIQGGQLLMAGGNQVSPAHYDLKSGICDAPSFEQGQSKANNGKFVGVFHGDTAIAGGRILHSSARNVATKGSFDAYREGRRTRFVSGGIPPAWNRESFAFVNFKFGKLTCLDSAKVAKQITEGIPRAKGQDRGFGDLVALLEQGDAVRWKTDLGSSNKFEVVSLLVCPNAVVAVTHFQSRNRAQPQWWLSALDKKNGQQILRQEIRGEPLPDGLLMDRQGQVVVAMLDGSHLCFGQEN